MRSFLLLIFLLFHSVAADAPAKPVVECEKRVNATVGKNVTLPCYVEPPYNMRPTVIRWEINGTRVHGYQGKGNHTEDQNKEYENKTSIWESDVVKGNISLRLTNVTENHAGNYTCGVMVSRLYTEGHVYLFVDQKMNSSQTGNVSKEKPGNDHTIIIIIGGGGSIVAIVAIVVISLKRRNSKKRKRSKSQTDSNQHASSGSAAPSASSPSVVVTFPPSEEEGQSKHLRKRPTISSSSSSSQTSEQNSGTSHEQSNSFLPEDSCE